MTSHAAPGSHLCAKLWSKVGVAEFGGDVEPEAIRVLHDCIAQLDAHSAALLERLLGQQRLQ
jgi:hypothetical protein